MFKNLKNYFICIGCNYNGSLSGCVNDSKEMFNTFSKIDNEEIYLINDQETPVTVELLRNRIKEIHEMSKNMKYRIVLSFAGHGHSGGKIQLSDSILSNTKLFEIINTNSSKLFELILILDSCYSGGFINLKTYKNISNIIVITSCNSSQKSSESISTKYDTKENYYIGVFTYNFTSIINNLIENNQELTIENIFNNDIWLIISKIANQSYQIK